MLSANVMFSKSYKGILQKQLYQAKYSKNTNYYIYLRNSDAKRKLRINWQEIDLEYEIQHITRM